MHTPYDGFDDWADVQLQFTGDEPEPDHVFIAEYTYKSYAGYALVAYANNGKFYINTGGHDSCYGLEDQWDPTEYDTKEEFIECLSLGRRNSALIELIRAY